MSFYSEYCVHANVVNVQTLTQRQKFAHSAKRGLGRHLVVTTGSASGQSINLLRTIHTTRVF